jgi:hypothetical protein
MHRKLLIHIKVVDRELFILQAARGVIRPRGGAMAVIALMFSAPETAFAGVLAFGQDDVDEW